MEHPLLTKIKKAVNLEQADLDLLAQVGDDVRVFDARRDIVREGERPGHVHLMLEGWACRYQVLPDGRRQITAFLMPGDLCDSHITMLPEMDHSIATLTKARVAFLSQALMQEIADRPALTRALWWLSLVDEAVLRAWIVNLGRRDAFDRVAHLVCELHARLRNVGLADAGDFAMPLTQEELSDAMGLTPVHIGRVLKRLRQEGLMTFQRQQIVITDIARLRRVAGFDPNYLHFDAGAGGASG